MALYTRKGGEYPEEIQCPDCGAWYPWFGGEFCCPECGWIPPQKRESPEVGA